MARKLFSIILLIVEVIIYYLLFSLMKINLGLLRESLGLYLIYMFIFGHYYLRDTLVWDEIQRVFKATVVYIATFIVVLPLSLYQDKRRYIIFFAFIMFFVSIFVSRTLRIIMRQFIKRRTLVIGTGKDALKYARTANNNRFAVTEIIGFVNMNHEPAFNQKFENVVEGYEYDYLKYEVFSYHDLKRIVEERHIEQIAIVDPNISQKAIDIVMRDVITLVNKIKYMAQDNHMMNFSSDIRDINGFLMISASRNETNYLTAFGKRMIDIVTGMIGVLCTLPLALIVKIMNLVHHDHAPIFYTQKRVGKNGKIIDVYKFRSMIPNAEEKLKEILANDPALREEWEYSAKLKKDPRITPAGKFLRKTSLDEFPQFFNILKGDMSLIGPRPVIEEELKWYGEDTDKFLSVRPGLTGYWASHGRSEVDYPERCELELYYVSHQSILLDLEIVIKTALGVFLGEGAR